MAVTATGRAVGSISGGCVESAVYEAAGVLIAEGGTALETYGISDDEAFSVGLTCGGVIQVLVAEPDKAALALALERIQADESVTLATVISGAAARGAMLAVTADDTAGSLGARGLDAAVTDDARGTLAEGRTTRRYYGSNGESPADDVTILIQSFSPPPRMLVFGATDFAAAITDLGVFLGYRVTLCDARPVFATSARFPRAHEVICDWPSRYFKREQDSNRVDSRTVLAVLTHDPKFDVPLLQVALRSPACYIGVMGSRRTDEDRRRRLREAGVTESELSRMHSPIGLDLGARTAEETAVSVAAEIIASRWGGTGAPLGERCGQIHRAVPDTGT